MPENSVKIREAQTKDASRIYKLSLQLGWDASPAEVAERLEYVLAHSDDYVCYAAEVDGKVMGFANVNLKIEMHSGWQARIDGIVVDEKARGLGLGRLLMEATEKWAKEHGSKSMKLVSNAKRVEAHQFYEKIGYENTKTQLAFRKKL